MRHKIFLLSEDLNFFYRINKELERLNIRFKILNIWNILPKIQSIIITTSKEIKKINLLNEKINVIFAYSEEDNFDKFVLKILAVYKVDFKENYTNLLISIDPGAKHSGFIVFLDDYYLISYTFFENQKLLEAMENIIDTFQNDNQNTIEVEIKIGKMALHSIDELLKEIFKYCEGMTKCRIFLIDEAKSSKIKIRLNKRKFPKHEASALILALREGLEVNKSNYLQNIKIIKTKGIRDQKINENYDDDNEFIKSLREAADKILKGERSLTESKNLINR